MSKVTQKEFYADFAYVWNRLLELYTAPDAHQWLYSVHPQLNGDRPIDLMHVGRTAEVTKILDRMDDGAYL